MRRIVAAIVGVIVALVILYVMLQASAPRTDHGDEPDTRCIAARIGLPCSS